MKKSIVILVSVLFIVSALLSAEEKHCGKHEIGTDCKEKKNYVLQFSIEDNFKLSSFNGTTIALKKQFSEKSAMRLELSMNFDARDVDSKIDTNNNYADEYLIDDKYDSHYTSLNSYYMFESPRPNNITLYFGMGPKFSYSRRIHDYTKNPQLEYGYITKIKTDSKSFGYGLSSIFGVEWNFYKNFALNAEYGLSMTYSTDKDISTAKRIYDSEITEIEKTTDDGKSFRISNKPVKLGLAVYF